MPAAPVDSFSPLFKGLACAVLNRGLERVIVFDASFRERTTIMEAFRSAVETAEGKVPLVSHLQGSLRDDDLMGTYWPFHEADADCLEKPESMALTWRDGLLTKNRLEDRPLIVFVPDLSSLRLAAARSCVTLMGAPQIHLERHDRSERWRSRIFWLAFCQSAKSGRVSVHLMDRFALRLHASNLFPPKTTGDIYEWLKQEDGDCLACGTLDPRAVFDEDEKARLRQALRTSPVATANIFDRMRTYRLSERPDGHRREIAFARIVRALARLRGLDRIEERSIDEAAELIGLKPVSEEPPAIADEFDSEEDGRHGEKSRESDEEQTPEPTEENDAFSGSDTASGHESPDEGPVSPKSENAVVVDPSPMPPSSPYPEDSAPVAREMFALRVPFRRLGSPGSDRGTIIGVSPAESLRDLAIVETVLEAAKYQNARRKNRPGDFSPFLFSPKDLRCYRRIPPPDRMLVLLIDYTCLRGRLWQEALLPHLRWAYTNRATVCVVQVGAKGAASELLAQTVEADSVLKPSIAEALELEPGMATPLAHGLETARRSIRRSREHGRNPVQNARLVAVTDGRGNVPLQASETGEIQLPINREGIDDALSAADKLGKLNRLDAFLLDPQPRHHAELPEILADALGAERSIVKLAEEAE